MDVLTTVDELITNPPQIQDFINNNYMKTDDSGELVPVYTAIIEDRDPWNEERVQDETRETQAFFGDDWLDKTAPPQLE